MSTANADQMADQAGDVLASLGIESIADNVSAWQKARLARLHRRQFQLTAAQLEIVERSLEFATANGTFLDDGSPNRRGTALTAICRSYIEHTEETK